MNIDRYSASLDYDLYTSIHNASEKEIFERFRKILKDYIDIIDNLVNQDFKKLSDEEFYDLLCKVYDISLMEDDYLKIISKRNGKKYNKFSEIGTFMGFTDVAREGHGRDFSWWKQLYQIRYAIAVAEDTEIEFNSAFLKEDIKKMIENKSIVIIERLLKPVSSDFEVRETVEEMPLMNLNYQYFKVYSGRMGGSIIKDENFSIVVSMLRKKFTKKRILKDMRDYVEELQNGIETVLYDFEKCFNRNEALRLFNDWYIKSGEAEKLSILRKKIGNN